MSCSGIESLEGMTVLVTGAGGQLGGYLRPILEAAGASVIGLGARQRPGVDVLVDIASATATASVLSQKRPDLVIHAAAWTDVDGCELDPERAEAINARGSHNVARAAKNVGSHLVAVSTDFVFGASEGAPFREDAPPSPVSVYGRSKRSGEEAVLNVDPQFAVARTAWVYGGSGKHFPRTVLTMVRQRGQMDVVADEIGNPTFAGDLAVALVALAATGKGGIFHLVNAGYTSRYELAQEVAAIAGYEPDVIAPTTAREFMAKFPLPAARPANSSLQNVRAAELGITLRPWQEAIANYVPKLAAELDQPLTSEMQ